MPAKPVLLTDGDRPVALAKTSWRLPSPLPVFTVMVNVVLEPELGETLVTLGLPTLPAPPVKVKLLAVNPLMAVANVAVYCTEARLVSVLFTAVKELIVVG